MTSDFTPEQREVLSCLPDTRKNIAENLGITPRAVRYRMSAMEEKGAEFHRDEYGIWHWEGSEEVHRISTKAKSSITREANEHLASLEARIKKLLERERPAVTSLDVDKSNEDIVIFRSDDHIGQVVRNERGEEVFNTDIAVERIRSIMTRAISLADREEKADRSFDNVHLLLGGDTVTGEVIYHDQPHDIDRTLDKQIDEAVNVYYEQIERLSDRFDTVNVVCQGGNHGEIRVNGMSKKANADDVAYAMLDFAVRKSNLDNVNFIRSESSNFVNTQIRGHNVHLRHGQDFLKQAHGTSAAESRARNWIISHGADIILRGHYHVPTYETVNGVPILMNGSICPPGDYADSIGAGGNAAAWLFGVSDKRIPTFLYPVEWK